MGEFRYGGRPMQLIEFSDVSVDGMVFECWEGGANDDEQTLVFSLVEHEGKVALRVHEPAVDLELLQMVVQMVEFTPGFDGDDSWKRDLSL